MKIARNILITLLLGISIPAFAQGPPPGGGGRPGGGPDEMIKREKLIIYEKMSDLTADQKLLLDGIYKEFATTLQETMEAQRGPEGREAQREKMEALTKEKDLLIADVLNVEQYKIYEKLTKPKNERKKGDKPDKKN